MGTLQKIKRVLEIVATVAAVGVVLIDTLEKSQRPTSILKQ
jgi:hypothetical protein